MSDSYTKLFSSITASTIVSEPLATRWLWVTMLAMADQNGHVWGSIPGLARIANIAISDVESGLQAFLSPDPYSRTKENEGRRISEVDGGWLLLNHGKYRAIRSAEERREYMREYMRQRRESEKKEQEACKQDCKQPLAMSTEITPPTPSPTPKKKTGGAKAPLVIPDWLPASAWSDWHSYRNSTKGWTRHARQLALTKLATLREQGHDPVKVIEQSIECGWTGLFPIKKDRSNGSGHYQPLPGEL